METNQCDAFVCAKCAAILRLALPHKDWTAITTQSSTEWISVKDNPPRDCETVLTWDGHCVRSAEILCVEEDKVVFLDVDVCFSGVTHWMPLPETPNECHNDTKQAPL